MIVTITRKGKPVEFSETAVKAGVLPIVYSGSGTARIGEFGVMNNVLRPHERNRIIPLQTGLTVTIPEGTRGVVVARAGLSDNTPDSKYPASQGVEVVDGMQYLDAGTHELALHLRSTRTMAGPQPVYDGDVVAFLRFESVPKVLVNQEPKRRGRPPKAEKAA